MHKKIFTLALSLFILIFCSTTQAFAKQKQYNLSYQNKVQAQKHISNIGFRILNANRIEDRVVFILDGKENIVPRSYWTGKRVVIHQGILQFIDNEDELAAIIAHEVAHQLDFHKGFLRAATMLCATRKYEKKADKVAVDLMVRAGFNPLGLITVQNKFSQQSYQDFFFTTHPKTSKKLAYIYEYIYVKYPVYLVNNSYKDNVFYQNFLLTTYKDREKSVREYKAKKENIKNISNKTKGKR